MYSYESEFLDEFIRNKQRKLAHLFNLSDYCPTKISVRAKCSISRIFSLFIVPSPFFVHCPYKGRINRAEGVLTGIKPYQP